MSDPILLTDIPFTLDRDALADRTHVWPDSPFAEELARLADSAEKMARPKAMFKLAFVDCVDDNQVLIDGITFTSRVLRVNLDQTHRVFAFIATAGIELERWERSLSDMLYQFWAEKIQELALQTAYQALLERIEAEFAPGPLSTMNPGSLSDWPLYEQRPLFKLLGDPRSAIGVELTDSMLMIPAKSISGLKFSTQTRYENCQLCPRPECPGRRAPYDPDLYRQRYAPR